LIQYKEHPQALILALPRGGVPIAYAASEVLRLPVDIFVVRKLGVPGQEEVAMGAIASGGVRILNRSIIEELRISEASIALAAAVEQRELERRENLYQGDRFLPHLEDRIVLLVDDGIATGASLSAAIMAIRALKPSRLIAAVPVSSAEGRRHCSDLVDEMVVVMTVDRFKAVGSYYSDFAQVSDDQVKYYLGRAEQVASLNR